MDITANIVVLVRIVRGFMAVNLGDRNVTPAPLRVVPGSRRMGATASAADGTIAKGASNSRENRRLPPGAARLAGQWLHAALRQAQGNVLTALSTGAPTGLADCQAGAQRLIAEMESQLDRNFKRKVVLCLQHLSHYAWLGQSGLASEILIQDGNHIERGKALRDELMSAIENLRPAGQRPSGMRYVPQEWRSYTILHMAYVEDVPNRDIMSSLYISDSTFYRYRREAVRAVARALLEARRSTLAGAQTPPHVTRHLGSLIRSRPAAD